jgi:hypothetical protein
MIKKSLLSLLLVFAVVLAKANPTDEGMWLPILLKKYNYDQMKKLGLKLKPEQLYDVNKASLKDAIVWFDGGCTGEIISNTGLLLTNHHCGYESVQSHSTVEDNILDNGFWAKSLAEEKTNKGMFASILVRMEDVSAKILPNLMGLNDEQKAGKLKELTDTIVAQAKNGNHYEAFVKDIFKNNQYILFVMEKFTDIRLVGTPPQNIGKFGGDTDNWMWPRHTCDFSMFRIYANKDNQPADYSADNVPYKPKSSLTVSLDGVKEGDFTMIMGYPGRTNRYETSMGIQMAVDKVNPAIVKLLGIRLDMMKEQMDKDVAVRIQLSSQYARLANGWKYYIGQTEQIKHLKAVNQRKNEEEKFIAWAATKDEYKNILPNLEKVYAQYTPISDIRLYVNVGIFGSTAFAMANGLTGLEKALTDKDEAAIKKAVDGLKGRLEGAYETFNAAAEQKIIAAVLSAYYHDIEKQYHPAILGEIVAMYPGASADEAFKKYAADVMANAVTSSAEKLSAFLENPTLAALQADPARKVAQAFTDYYNKNLAEKVTQYNGEIAKEGEVYMRGLMAMNPNTNYYPDANSTFRLTYGSVKAYSPKDGVHYDITTTLDGVEEKYIPGDGEFDAPKQLLELNRNNDFGIYVDKKTGEMVTCFITDNDITGGNSGSPVMNGKGELIGIAFDGNWEAMSGDIVFDTRYKRTISVDIRYVLFIIDKLAGAKHIVKELNLVKDGKKVTLN